MTTEQIASRYNVIKKLGEGGMGVVSLVEDTTNGEKVALKVLSSAIGATDDQMLILLDIKSLIDWADIGTEAAEAAETA